MSNKKASKIVGIIMVTICAFIWVHDIYSQVKSEDITKLSQEQEEKSIEQEEKTKKQKEYEKIQSILKENKDDLTILVNKENPLPDYYHAKNLVSPNVIKMYDKISLRNDTAQALEEMLSKAKDDNIILYLKSGYRTARDQKRLYDASLKRNGKEYTEKYQALPNKSEHQTGLAVDLTCDAVNKRLVPSFENTKEGKWLSQNAHKYGFILRYKKGREDDTGYAFEPWHFRYIGKEIATYIYENDLILEDLYNGN